MDKSKVEMALLLYDSRKYTIKEITEQTGESKAKLYQVLKTRKVLQVEGIKSYIRGTKYAI